MLECIEGEIYTYRLCLRQSNDESVTKGNQLSYYHEYYVNMKWGSENECLRQRDGSLIIIRTDVNDSRRNEYFYGGKFLVNISLSGEWEISCDYLGSYNVNISLERNYSYEVFQRSQTVIE